ncbi:MAG: aldehyde dehydrogenase family protein [Acidobacteriota bacterium]|nr:aldehyde dehydrogenase family protein [Thermoanaerobaculaceae bacterium]
MKSQIDRIMEEVKRAQTLFAEFNEEKVNRIIDAIHSVSMSNLEKWARFAKEETGYGKIEDKVIKNRVAAEDVYKYIRVMKTTGFISAKPEMGIYEVASPMGIVAAVIPSTNPTSTAIYKIMISLKARNGIVISPHPFAKNCIKAVVDAISDAAVSAGAPKGIIGIIDEPSIEDTQYLMKHHLTNVILATGGLGLVRAAYSSGKPAYGVGPGNVPAFIERTADVKKAVKDVVAGKSFDWGTVCASEQSLIVDLPVAQKAKELLKQEGCYFVNQREKAQLESLIVDEKGNLNPKIVAKSPQVIAQMAGFEVPSNIKVLVVEENGVGREHPLTLEKLSPVLTYFEEDGWEAGCRRCIEVLNYGGLGHTLCLHSQDLNVIREFALKKPAFRILVNTPGTHGAIGYTTNLPPALTLGCGALGNNITSDNITPLHLMDIKRVAFETKPINAKDVIPLKPLISPLEIYGYEYQQKKDDGDFSPKAPAKEQIDSPFDFVSEEDVRKAKKENRRIKIHSKTIITPLAKELGENWAIFEKT